jgi:hypothetical protein
VEDMAVAVAFESFEISLMPRASTLGITEALLPGCSAKVMIVVMLW